MENRIESNNITGNRNGILLGEASRYLILGNNITGNSFGIYFDGSARASKTPVLTMNRDISVG